MIQEPAAAAQMVIAYRALASLKPYVRNSRTHTPKQIAKLEASLLAFGWTTPIAVAGDDILAGHARVTAASNLAASGRAIPRHPDPRIAPTVDLSHLSPAERRAYIIADNKLAEEAGWDNGLLRLELSDLKAEGFDLTMTGFGSLAIGLLLGKAEDAEGPKMPAGLQYQVIVECRDEAHQAEVLRGFAATGLKARPLIL